jgi:putative PIG3 family NAD(P)H quinone oxidoreductase
MHATRVLPDQALQWGECPDPQPAPGEVLVRVHATALNRADLMQRAGHYPPPPGASEVLGLEMAGRIVGVGAGVTAWRTGQDVCALLPGGGYAALAAVPADMLLHMPPGWSYAQAAALPEAALTAFVNLYTEAALQPAETVLVHAGASGVGTAAIQLCKASGNPVYATVGSAQKAAHCRAMGALQALDHHVVDFAAELLRAVGAVDVILDPVGAGYFERNLQLLRVRGRLVLISTLSGAQAALDLRVLMGKRLRVIGSVLRSRALAEKVAITRAFVERFWPAVVDGRLLPVIDSEFAITDAAAAHARMAANLNIGKIVLHVP